MLRLRMSAVLLAMTLGCRGESVEAAPSDAAASGDGEAGPCLPLSDNLLANGSFELWEGAACVGWDGPVARVDKAAFDCKVAGRVSMNKYDGIKQDVDLAAPLAAGTQLEITAAVRWVSGGVAAPIFDLEFEAPGGKTLGPILPATVTGYKADGAFHTVTSTVAAPAGATWMRFFVGSTAPEPQQLDFDAVVVRVK